MDKTMTIVMAAVVMVVLGATLMFVYSDQIDQFDSDADRLSGRGCEYQQQRVANSDQLTENDLSPRCGGPEPGGGSSVPSESTVNDALCQLEGTC